MEKKDWKKKLRELSFMKGYYFKLEDNGLVEKKDDRLVFNREELERFVQQELDKAREEGRLSVIQELLFEPEEPSHNIGTLEAAFKYEDIIKRYSGEWRNKTGLVSPKYIKSKLKDNK